jgi:hypothetical protein
MVVMGKCVHRIGMSQRMLKEDRFNLSALPKCLYRRYQRYVMLPLPRLHSSVQVLDRRRPCVDESSGRAASVSRWSDLTSNAHLWLYVYSCFRSQPFHARLPVWRFLEMHPRQKTPRRREHLTSSYARHVRSYQTSVASLHAEVAEGEHEAGDGSRRSKT